MSELDRIAVKSRPVVIENWQERWDQEFQCVGKRIRRVLGTTALRIDHVGSTSVPNLAAKDIVDLQVTVESLDNLQDFNDRMKAAGYQKRGDIQTDCLVGLSESASHELRKCYFRESEGERRIHIHVRQKGLLNQRYALLFRDYLRANEAVRVCYELIKRRLAVIFPESIGGYLYIKDPLMDIIYQGAESWAKCANWSEDDLHL